MDPIRRKWVDLLGCQSTPESTLVKLIVEVAIFLWPNFTWIIDNIHRMSIFDCMLLKELSASDRINSILISARQNEVKTQVSELIGPWLNNTKSYLFELSYSSNKIIVKSLLKSYFQTEFNHNIINLEKINTIQELMFSLKELKALGFLSDKDGKLVVNAELIAQGEFNYREAIINIYSGLEEQFPALRFKEALWQAAVYGHSFPIEFLAESDNRYIEVLEKLLDIGLIVPVEENQAIKGWLKFDHELTHQIILQIIPQTSLYKLHKLAIDYITSPIRYREKFDDGKLVGHYIALGRIKDFLNCSRSYASYLKLRGHYKDAIKIIEIAHDEYERNLIDDSLSVIECALIDDILVLMEEVGESGTELFRRRVSAFKMCLKILGTDAPKYTESRLALYELKLACFKTQKIEKLKELFSEKISKLVGLGRVEDIVEARRFLSIRLKQSGDFLSSALQIRKILHLLRGCKVEDSKGYKAFAYLNIGSLSLESQKYHSVLPWWDKAVLLLTGRNNIGKLAHALVDQAYAYALLAPYHVGTRELQENAIHFTKRYGLRFQLCRALINFANWLAFHSDEYEHVTSCLTEAESLASQLDDLYLQFLISFSKLNVMAPNNLWSFDTNLESIQCYLKSLDLINPGELGDKRVANCIDWILNQESSVKEGCKKTLPFMKNFEVVEVSNNLYYMGNGKYATYY